MTPTIAPLRAIGALSAGLVALGMLSACTSEPMPTPTRTTLFSSDEEAFKAAEETYQAYVDATNAVDLANSASFEPVYHWLTGTALAPERESLTLYHAENLRKVGDSRFDSFDPVSFDGEEVVAQLCIDSEDVDLLNADGSSALPADRAMRHGRKVIFVAAGTRTGLKIASSQKPAEGFIC